MIKEMGFYFNTIDISITLSGFKSEKSNTGKTRKPEYQFNKTAEFSP
ncbi:hypothetical protein [Photorhabdus khanii]|nr:hypothetical protein [Photorhabdus khanii]